MIFRQKRFSPYPYQQNTNPDKPFVRKKRHFLLNLIKIAGEFKGGL